MILLDTYASECDLWRGTSTHSPNVHGALCKLSEIVIKLAAQLRIFIQVSEMWISLIIEHLLNLLLLLLFSLPLVFLTLFS